MPVAVVTFDHPAYAELIRGQTATLAPVLRSEADAVLTPTSWTGSLYRAGAQLLTGSGTGAISLALPIPSTYELADDYELRWSVVYSGGRVEARQEASVCLAGLYPVLTASQIYARAPALNPSAAGSLRIWAAGQSVMTLAAEAWRDIVVELRSRGVRPRLVTSSEDLRPLHLARTMELVWRSVATTLNDSTYRDHANDAHAEYTGLWGRLSLRQAPADDAGSGGARNSGRAPVIGGAFGDNVWGRYPGGPDVRHRSRGIS
jgi:hypothetical protein